MIDNPNVIQSQSVPREEVKNQPNIQQRNTNEEEKSLQLPTIR
jgi:hypothetical protein